MSKEKPKRSTVVVTIGVADDGLAYVYFSAQIGKAARKKDWISLGVRLDKLVALLNDLFEEQNHTEKKRKYIA